MRGVRDAPMIPHNMTRPPVSIATRRHSAWNPVGMSPILRNIRRAGNGEGASPWPTPCLGPERTWVPDPREAGEGISVDASDECNRVSRDQSSIIILSSLSTKLSPIPVPQIWVDTKPRTDFLRAIHPRVRPFFRDGSRPADLPLWAEKACYFAPPLQPRCHRRDGTPSNDSHPGGRNTAAHATQRRRGGGFHRLWRN
jgi:hypothetical protein